MSRFTHYGTPEKDGRIDLLAGDVINCHGCGVQLFRDYAFISDGIDPDVRSEPESMWSQIALGRSSLDDSAEPVDAGALLCESCVIEGVPARAKEAR